MIAERHLLLVEDNPDDEALIVHALQQYELAHRVLIARDGVAALAYLRPESGGRQDGQPALPAALITDLKLPRLDGFELLRRVRADEHSCLMPIIVLSTSAHPEEVREAYRLGANSFVVKPTNLDHFVDTVGLLARYWLNINTTAPLPLFR